MRLSFTAGRALRFGTDHRVFTEITPDLRKNFAPPVHCRVKSSDEHRGNIREPRQLKTQSTHQKVSSQGDKLRRGKQPQPAFAFVPLSCPTAIHQPASEMHLA
jgi:hypothetical protein